MAKLIQYRRAITYQYQYEVGVAYYPEGSGDQFDQTGSGSALTTAEVDKEGSGEVATRPMTWF